MFTGIVTALGSVREIAPIGAERAMRLTIAAPALTPSLSQRERVKHMKPPLPLAGEGRGEGGPSGDDLLEDGLATGASVACSGCCLTVVDKGPDWFAVDVSAETLARTTLGRWEPGTPVNLERALRLGDELGGHIVLGHVDGVGEAVSAIEEQGSVRWRFSVPDALARFIALKGSIAVDGVSLTVNEVEGSLFGVNIIPHTAAVTNFGTLRPGATVNIEIDTLARYVARLEECR